MDIIEKPGTRTVSAPTVTTKITGMNDGGTRIQFGETSAMREDQSDKSRIELISPHALRRLGTWCGKGAKKYGERNWEKGMPFMRCIGSILRHVAGYILRDNTEDHLAAIMWNAMAIIHYEECQMTSWDDRPVYSVEGKVL